MPSNTSSPNSRLSITLKVGDQTLEVNDPSELPLIMTCTVSTLEGELSQMETDKKAAEFELKQMMEGWAHFASQVSRLVGVVEGGANSPQQCGSLQHMAGYYSQLVTPVWLALYVLLSSTVCWRGTWT